MVRIHFVATTQLCGSHDEVCQTSKCVQRAADCQLRSRSFSCDCSGTGFSGDLCHVDVDECSAAAAAGGDCLHGGLCINTAGSFRCDCSRTGFTGSRCEVDVDECSDDHEAVKQPCHNSGQSVPSSSCSFNTACQTQPSLSTQATPS